MHSGYTYPLPLSTPTPSPQNQCWILDSQVFFLLQTTLIRGVGGFTAFKRKEIISAQQDKKWLYREHTCREFQQPQPLAPWGGYQYYLAHNVFWNYQDITLFYAINIYQTTKYKGQLLALSVHALSKFKSFELSIVQWYSKG